MNIARLFTTIIRVAKANPALVISAVTAIGPVVGAIKAEGKRGRL